MSTSEISVWSRYWNAYGGFKALLYSRYFIISCVVTLVTFPFWMQSSWWDLPLSIMPNLLGFSLGGLAILIGVIQPETMSVLATKDKATSITTMSKFTATFTHFVLVHAACLFLAILCKATYWEASTEPERQLWVWSLQLLGWGFSWLVFVYALTLTFATSIEVFRFSEILQELARFRSGGGGDESN